MAGRRKSPAASAPPADTAPAPAPAARVPAHGPRAYRLTVAHQHAGVQHQPGDELVLDEAMAARIRRVAGDGALVEVPA